MNVIHFLLRGILTIQEPYHLHWLPHRLSPIACTDVRGDGYQCGAEFWITERGGFPPNYAEQSHCYVHDVLDHPCLL